MTQKSPLLIMIRPALQSAQTVQDLTQRLGRMPRVIVNPLMTIQDLKASVPDDLPMPFIFTSQNAVSIAARKTKRRGDVFCVGLRVAKLAQEMGFNPIETFQTAGEMLARGLPSNCSYMRGAQVSMDLAKTAKVSISEVILYRQTPLPLSTMTRKQISRSSIVPVYSENMAMRLVDVTQGIPQKPSVVCISDKAARPLQNLQFSKVIVAPEPTAQAMIDTVSSYL